MEEEKKDIQNHYFKCQKSIQLIRFPHSFSYDASSGRLQHSTLAVQKKWVSRVGEVQLIGNIWVIVGSTPTSSSVGWDLTVPSEVTALTSASVHACSCQRPVWLKKEDRARRFRHWMVPLLLMGALLTANVSAGVKYNQLVVAFGLKKKKKTPTAFQNIWGTLFRCVP